MALQKKTIEEIAKKRELSKDTVLKHLELLVSQNSNLDLEYLQSDKRRFEKIKKAFEQTGNWKLSFVREILGKDFSYEELRLTRLLITPNL